MSTSSTATLRSPVTSTARPGSRLPSIAAVLAMVAGVATATPSVFTATLARAGDVALVTCSGEVQQWEVHASAQGREGFQHGSATAVGLARTSDGGDTDDAHQWLVNVTLVGE